MWQSSQVASFFGAKWAHLHYSITFQHDIVFMVSKNQDQDNPEENDKEDVSSDLVSYADAVSATLHGTTRCGYIDRRTVEYLSHNPGQKYCSFF
ncbi:hypothetical protein AVEN_246032-1 [Araneus ventricosus]|uniref:Uncharacterized protein n=1 Tax=Araneus ventricosus TaxID=182803 RepID=A0A4Y2WEX3_ARAVE|nr:hypothetical protein AVEN_246032-1 [Araneus ventricosus]